MSGEGREPETHSTESPDEAAMLKLALERFAFGVLIIDAGFEIRYGNPYAKALLEVTWPGETREDYLFASGAPARQELERLMAAGGGAVTLPRDTARSPLEVLVTCLGDASPGDATPEGLALICLLDPDRVPASSPERLQQLYGATPAEAQVAAALSRGERLAEGAQALGVTQATVRSHVQALCRKLGTERKAELVWRLNACVATLIVASDWLSNLKDIL